MKTSRASALNHETRPSRPVRQHCIVAGQQNSSERSEAGVKRRSNVRVNLCEAEESVSWPRRHEATATSGVGNPCFSVRRLPQLVASILGPEKRDFCRSRQGNGSDPSLFSQGRQLRIVVQFSTTRVFLTAPQKTERRYSRADSASLSSLLFPSWRLRRDFSVTSNDCSSRVSIPSGSASVNHSGD